MTCSLDHMLDRSSEPRLERSRLLTLDRSVAAPEGASETEPNDEVDAVIGDMLAVSRGGTAGGERACLLPGRLREGANALVFLVLARDAGPPEQEEVAVVTLARAEVILAQ